MPHFSNSARGLITACEICIYNLGIMQTLKTLHLYPCFLDNTAPERSLQVDMVVRVYGVVYAAKYNIYTKY